MATHTSVDIVYWNNGKWDTTVADLAMHNHIVYSFSTYNYVTFEM